MVEYMMVHAGYIGLVAIASRCSKIYLLGDKNQIPFIDRLQHVNMKFSDANKLISSSELLNVTYRCPADVAFALEEFYPNISSKSQTQKSVQHLIMPPNLAMLPVVENSFYLTFTKADKKLLSSQLNIPSSSKVLTIHEAQGLTSPNVICVRTNPHPLELFDSVPHAIVAISRHTFSFKYFTPVENDRLYSIVKKAQSYNVKKTKSNEVQSNSQKRKDKGNFSIYFQNVNKMASKASKFYNFVLKTNYKIYVISETALNPGIHSSEYFGQDYVVYRCDRSSTTSYKKSGGGVLIAVHSQLCSASVSLSSTIEQICVKIKINKKYMFIYTAYIPPQSSNDCYAACVESINEVINTSKSSDLVLVLGDFNLPNITWSFDHESHCILPSNITTVAESLFVDALHSYNLTQINTIANNRERFLDLVFTNECETFAVMESLNPFVINDINHKPIDIIFNASDCLPKRSEHHNKFKYNFNKANYADLRAYFEVLNWDDILIAEDINKSVDKFYEIVMLGIEQHVPFHIQRSTTHPPWFDDRLINLKNRKSKAYANMLKSGLQTDINTFRHVKKEFDLYFNLKYKAYLADIEDKIKDNPKHFWKYFRSKREIDGYPANMSYNNINSSNDKEIADMFASFFQSVYQPIIIKRNIKLINNNNVSITPPAIFEEHILAALKSFGDGCGPDNIPSSLLKMYADIFAQPLCNLFNYSLATGVFPEKWKISKITPIFKSGRRDDITCYRGISTTSSIPKLFELVVCNAFKSTLIRHISINQHGFMPGRSTTTNLIEFTSQVINEIENHHQVDVAYTDFSKAFDSISHQKALQSMLSFGFSLEYINWFESYLTNRVQYVTIGNEKSNVINVTSGVPQGSHIGPWIFIVFINSITETLKNSKVLLFADDVKIYRVIEELHDVTILQDDINIFNEWCNLNSLHLNVSKCKIMSYHRKKNPIMNAYKMNNIELQRVYETTDLGVNFVTNVTFNNHIDKCISKANMMFGFMKRWAGEFKNINTLRTLYFSYVRSQVEYAVPVWNPHYAIHMQRIESIQKQFLLYLLKKTGWDYDRNVPYYVNVARLQPYLTRCKEYGLCTLKDRRQLLEAALIGNVLLGHIDSSFILENISLHVPSRSLRNHRFLATTSHSTNYGDNNPMNRLAKSFNTLDTLFDFHLTKDKFKYNLKTYFLNC